MEENFDLEKTLIEFNQDQQFIELRERYSTRSFLEIMSVERSENRHSSFLAWLLSAKDFAVNVKDHPIVHLLDIAIRRLGEQGADITKENENIETKCDAITGEKGLKNIVLSRDIKDIDIEEVATEKAIKDVATDDAQSYKDNIQDRIDIYVKCKLKTSNCQNGKEITVIIENKVGSTEGQEKSDNKENASTAQDWKDYCKKKQTQRYYTACHSSQTIFIFLTPGKDKEVIQALDEHFINITYQDVLNEIIEPLLANQNLSSRVRVLLEEYILSLSLPGIYTNEEDKEDNEKKKKNIKNKKDDKSIKTAIIMAERKQDIDTIQKLLEKINYKNLIISAAKCLVIEDEIDKITKKIEEKKKSETKGKWSVIKDETIRAALEFEPGKTKVEDVYKLILSFGKTYKNLLIALLKTYVDNNPGDSEEVQTIKDVYQSLIGKPKDRSEFTIIVNNENILEKESKRMFADFIIRKYIDYRKNRNNQLTDPYEYFKINDNYPLFKSTGDSNPKDPTRYSKETVEIDGQKYYISNQWGITINQENWDKTKEEEYLISIDRIFFKIFAKALIELEDGKTYSTNNNNDEFKLTLQKPWDEILKDYTIIVKRIYK